jgi:hypothetical protein
MKEFAVIILLCVTVCGCATRITYYLEGKAYPSKEAFVSAREQMEQRCMANLKGYDVPLVQRKLIAMLPSQEAVYKSRIEMAKASAQGANTTMDVLAANPLVNHVGRSYRWLAEKIQKKNIYSSVEIMEYETLSDPQPSKQADIFYVTLTNRIGGKDVLYMTTQRNGKQMISMDASNPICEAMAESFLASVQTIALQ